MTPTFRNNLRNWAAEQPDGIAIDGPLGTVSYALLNDQTTAWAQWLHVNGVRAGETVGLAVREETLHLVVTLALLQLGVKQITLASQDSAVQHAYLCECVGATCCLTDFDFSGPHALRVLRLPASPPEGSPLDASIQNGNGGIYLTGSGTTGVPKIVFFTELQLAEQALRGYGDYRRERVYRTASVEFNNSKRLRLYTLYLGGCCVLKMSNDKSIHDICREHRVTWLELATFTAQDCVRASQSLGPLPAFTRVRLGGARVPIELRRDFTKMVCSQLHVSYGATELGGITFCGPEKVTDERESVGRPLPGVSFEIVDDADQPVPSGVVGHVRVKAAGMADAYVGNNEASQRSFKNGWFYPSDMARIDADGYVVLHGRRDDLMILNGINIFPAEVERMLENLPEVVEAACFPLKSSTHGEIPVAAVILKHSGAMTSVELLSHARQALGVRAPRAIVVVAEFPRNTQGKVVKRQLADHFGALASR
jgi:long-chain acyl-CoA synthetase